jgi:methyltransferase-like protein
MIRDVVLFHVQSFETPEKKLEQALALARFIADSTEDKDIYRQYLKQEMTMMLRMPPNYVLHDLLETVNQPLYFHAFTEHAARYQLQYLGEADFHEMLDRGFTPEVFQTLNQMAKNRIQREQYLDFLKCRRFRQTLLCHADVALDLSLKPELADRFQVAALASPASAKPSLYTQSKEKFNGPGESYLVTEAPITKVALTLLNERWPRTMPFAQLASQVRQRLQENQVPVSPDPQTDALALGEAFLRSYAAGLVELHLFQPRYQEQISARPQASPLVRWQATRANYVSSVFHRVIEIEDEPTRILFGLLDGTRDRAALQEEFLALLQARNLIKSPTGQALTDPQQTRVILAAEIEKNLARMARMGMLVG